MDHTEFLEDRKIQETPIIKITKHSFYSYLFTQRDDDISYKLGKLKLQLIDLDNNIVINIKRINKRIKESKRLGWIILLAFANRRIGKPIMKMISEKDFDMDQPVFRILQLPTFAFLYAHLRYGAPMKNYSLEQTWCGYSTGISYEDKQKTDIVSVMSTTQYRFFMNLKTLFNSNKTGIYDDVLRLLENDSTLSDVTEKPVVPVDFLFMNGNFAVINDILEYNTKIVRSSQLCYLLHSDTKLTLEMLRYNINVYQKFHGTTPLHVAARDGNLELVIIYLELGFDTNEQDSLGNTPLHYAAMNCHNNCYDYLTRKDLSNINCCHFDPAKTDILNISCMSPLAYKTSDEISKEVSDPNFIITLLKDVRNEAIKIYKFKIIKPNISNFLEVFKPIKVLEKKLSAILEPTYKIFNNTYNFVQIMEVIHGKPRSIFKNDWSYESMLEFFVFY